MIKARIYCLLWKGYTRRDFLKFATLTTAVLGLPTSLMPKVAKALETKPKSVVIRLELQGWAGCTESFIRSTSLLPTEVLLDFISLEYHEMLMAPSRDYAEKSKRKL